MNVTEPGASMRDIAGKAGVSVMTVSRALNNHPGLAPLTRERILQLAGELGYRPNPMVSALMRSRRQSPKYWSSSVRRR